MSRRIKHRRKLIIVLFMKPHIEYVIKLALRIFVCRRHHRRYCRHLPNWVLWVNDEKATTIERSKMECTNDYRWIIKSFHSFGPFFYCVHCTFIPKIILLNILVKFAYKLFVLQRKYSAIQSIQWVVLGIAFN